MPCQSVSWFICFIQIFLPIYLSFSKRMFLYIYLSTYLSIYQPIYLSIYLSIYIQDVEGSASSQPRFFLHLATDIQRKSKIISGWVLKSAILFALQSSFASQPFCLQASHFVYQSAILFNCQPCPFSLKIGQFFLSSMPFCLPGSHFVYSQPFCLQGSHFVYKAAILFNSHPF